LQYWTKAAFNSENEFTAPIYLKRAAMAHEENGDYKKAGDYYTTIKKKYPKSNEAIDIDKYITRADMNN